MAELPPDVEGPLRELVSSWASAYRNVSSCGKRLAELDVRRASVAEEMSREAKSRDDAERAINELLADVPDEFEADVLEIVEEEGGDALRGQLVTV